MLVDWRRAEAEDDGLELRLGLSIGRSFDVSSGPAKAGDPARRREARKRQQQRRDDRTALEAQRSLGRARDRTAREIEGLSSPNPNPNVGPVVVPMYFPVANGVGFPCMMPVLAPPARHRSEINFPAGGRSFPPFPAKEEMGGAGLKRCFSLTSESAVSGCSSGISDFLTASLRVRPSRASSSCSSSASSGDNSKKRSHSSLNATTEQPQEPQLQLHLKSPSQPTKEEPDRVARKGNAEKIEGKPEKQPVSLPRMPCVSTTGPDGKTINGFLYRYSKAEVSIVCVCHGSSFSPSEFVRHAGVTDVSHPLRQIVVVPSA